MRVLQDAGPGDWALVATAKSSLVVELVEGDAGQCTTGWVPEWEFMSEGLCCGSAWQCRAPTGHALLSPVVISVNHTNKQ
jgi:hypothetical protein